MYRGKLSFEEGNRKYTCNMRMFGHIKDRILYGVIVFYRQVTEQLMGVLRDAAGNVYLNDKCTGSVVGQQPFGGTRLSGKAATVLLCTHFMYWRIHLQISWYDLLVVQPKQ